MMAKNTKDAILLFSCLFLLFLITVSVSISDSGEDMDKQRVVDAARKAYDDAKHEVEEKYEAARDTMAENAKVNYEIAKEKFSHVTGDLGSTMEEEEEEEEL